MGKGAGVIDSAGIRPLTRELRGTGRVQGNAFMVKRGWVGNEASKVGIEAQVGGCMGDSGWERAGVW